MVEITDNLLNSSDWDNTFGINISNITVLIKYIITVAN